MVTDQGLQGIRKLGFKLCNHSEVKTVARGPYAAWMWPKCGPFFNQLQYLNGY